MTSGMTDRDKAAEYDRIAAYLRKNGWSVVREWRHPGDGTTHESWRHADDSPGSEHTLLTAYRVECYKDAPKQGARLTQNLDQLSRVIKEKQQRASDGCQSCAGSPPRVDMTQGRNERCACGSGKKFKACHLLAAHEAERQARIATAARIKAEAEADRKAWAERGEQVRRPNKLAVAALLSIAGAVTPTK